MNRPLIVEEDVKEFIRRLPDIEKEPPTAHITMLVIRSRYSKEMTGIKVKDIVTERKVIRYNERVSDWRAQYLNKVHNLAVLQAKGHYIVKDLLMPPEVYGILGTLYPRDVLKASIDLIKQTLDRIVDNRLALAKIDVDFVSALHRNKAQGRKFVTVDIDDESIYNAVYDELSSFDKWMITRTSRGYHIILEFKNSQAGYDFYHEKKGKEPNGREGAWPRLKREHESLIELQHDSQEPIPGTFYYNLVRPDNFVEIIE